MAYRRFSFICAHTEGWIRLINNSQLDFTFFYFPLRLIAALITHTNRKSPLNSSELQEQVMSTNQDPVTRLLCLWDIKPLNSFNNSKLDRVYWRNLMKNAELQCFREQNHKQTFKSATDHRIHFIWPIRYRRAQNKTEHPGGRDDSASPCSIFKANYILLQVLSTSEILPSACEEGYTGYRLLICFTTAAPPARPGVIKHRWTPEQRQVENDSTRKSAKLPEWTRHIRSTGSILLFLLA